MSQPTTHSAKATAQPAPQKAGQEGVAPGANWASTKEDQKAYSADRVKTDKVRTLGWWAFDLIVHTGLNLFVNIAISVLMVVDRSNYELNRAKDGLQNKFYAVPPENDLQKPLATQAISDQLHQSLKSGKPRRSFLDKITIRGKHFYNLSDYIDGKSAGFFSHLEFDSADTTAKTFANNLSRGAGKYVGGILFLAWGGHLTNGTMWALESPNVKPKIVRFLDKKVIEPVRGLFGWKMSEAEQAEQDQIYKKLDGELSGKSGAGVWGARAAGIGTIMGIGAILEATDKTFVTGKYKANESELGLLRVKQLVFGSAAFMQGGLNAVRDKKVSYSFLQKPEESVIAAQSSLIVGQSAVETVGSLITAFVQYMWLMSKELLGFGKDTNVKADKTATAKREKKANELLRDVEPAPKQQKAAPRPAIEAESPPDEAELPAAISENAEPAVSGAASKHTAKLGGAASAENHQQRLQAQQASASQSEQTLMPQGA